MRDTAYQTRRERRRERIDTRRAARRAGSEARWVVPALAVVFLLSGGAGLIHEVVWARRLGLLFGATTLAVSTVLAAYMAGLALGSYWIGRRMTRLGDRRRLYAWLEIGIGVSALLVPLALHLVEPLYGWLWRRFHFSFAVFSGLRLLIAGTLLLGPTLMMGATLPVLADYLATVRAGRLPPQWLYTVNLAGAVLGVAVGGFVLMPTVGLWGAILCGAAVNIGVGLVVLQLPPLAAQEAPTRAGSAPAARGSRGLLFAAALLSGAMSLATQVAWTRVLVLIVGSTTYAFNTVLLVYLVALALGSAWASGRGGRVPDVGPALAVMHVLMALCTLGAVYAVNRLPFWYLQLFQAWRPETLVGVVAMNTAIVFGTLLLPVLFAGTILPLAMIGALPADARGTGTVVGSIYAVNTVGAVLGAVLGGFLFIPTFGSQRTLLGVSVAAALVGVVFALSGERRRGLVGGVLGAAALAIAGAFVGPDWQVKPLTAGIFEARRSLSVERLTRPQDTVLYHREGPTATVVVLEQGKSRSLRINGRTNASDDPADMATQVLVAQLPLLLAPRVEDVFIIGWGSGVTAGAALQSPAQRVTAVELEPAVIEASRFFLPVNHDPLREPRLRLYQDDARHMLLASDDTYDAIVSEPSHPWVTGVANLFTQDFFALAARRLRADGVFAQWLQTYDISFETYRVILATFQSVFPEVLVFRSPPPSSDCILVGARRPIRVALAELDRRWSDAATRSANARVGIERPEDLLANLYAGPETVRALVKGAPLNTDNNMYVEFRAPREMAGTGRAGRRQILDALAGTPVEPEMVLADPETLLGSRERLQALVEALARRRRPTERHRKLLADLG